MAALDLAAKVDNFVLQNGTPNILTYQTPNDGNNHAVEIIASKNVSSTETGGAITLTATDGPTGRTLAAVTFFAGGSSAGLVLATNNSAPTLMVGPNSTISVQQSSALTVGASTVSVRLFVSDAAIPI